ncbi:ABC transporter permease [Phytomonospora sp. NPDC050363]|uniref:ABC transporter permease n=1 Tax=Phytomonospora sp. NPDC050363 TaxID=3155642 RepID=UPI0033C770E6
MIPRSLHIGAWLLVALAVLAVAAPLALPDPDRVDYTAELTAPGAAHPLGTDQLGRDLAARLAAGARTTLGSVGAVWLVSVAVGLFAGTLGALAGRLGEQVVARVVDLALALPQTVVALAIAGALGPGLWQLVLAMSATAWAPTARLAHTYVHAARERPDVIAARMAGIGPVRAMCAHVLPGAAARVVVVATLGVGQLILSLAALSFLGLGAAPPTAEWGRMLADSRHDVIAAPWLIIVPTTAIFLAVTAVSLVADGARERVDPGRRAWPRF